MKLFFWNCHAHWPISPLLPRASAGLPARVQPDALAHVNTGLTEVIHGGIPPGQAPRRRGSWGPRAASQACIALLCARQAALFREQTSKWPARRLLRHVDLPFIMVTTFGPQPLGLMVNGTVCPRPTVCALEWYTLLLLAVSRGSAYATYPIMILLFLSKANNLRSWLQRSCFSIFVPFHDLHHVHVIGGHVVGIAVAIHGLAHFTRWASQGNLAFLWTHVTGRSGVISLLLTPLIVLPMRWAKLRKQMRWELRKALHYLSIVWCFSICFHAPLQHIAWHRVAHVHPAGVGRATQLQESRSGRIWQRGVCARQRALARQGRVACVLAIPPPDPPRPFLRLHERWRRLDTGAP